MNFFGSKRQETMDSGDDTFVMKNNNQTQLLPLTVGILIFEQVEV
jgi:hypothetical protein